MAGWIRTVFAPRKELLKEGDYAGITAKVKDTLHLIRKIRAARWRHSTLLWTFIGQCAVESVVRNAAL
jgi:hypothetical protein